MPALVDSSGSDSPEVEHLEGVEDAEGAGPGGPGDVHGDWADQ